MNELTPTQKVLLGVKILNRKLEQSGMTEQFTFDDSLLAFRPHTDIFDHYLIKPIKRFQSEHRAVKIVFDKLCKEAFVKISFNGGYRKYYSTEYLFALIEEIVDRKEKAKSKLQQYEPKYNYPIRIKFKDEICTILDQKEYDKHGIFENHKHLWTLC